MKNSYCFVVALLVVIFTPLKVFAQIDSVGYAMDTVTVVSKRMTSSLRGGIETTMYWDLKMMHELPKILGNADPLHYTQLLPGVQTSSEYNAGLYIQGCDNAHNFISIGDVPIYNAGHLLGFFSVFNPSHFPKIRFEKNPVSAASANRLGGLLNMELFEYVPSYVEREFSVGPMSSQGTFKFPITSNSALYVSLRTAYLNLLYGQWLKIDGNQMDYCFQDYNATYYHAIDKKNKLWINVYYGNDDVGVKDLQSPSNLGLDWKNCLASIHWQRKVGEYSNLTQVLYLTQYSNLFNMDMIDTYFKLPSHIYSYGYKLKWDNMYVKSGFEVACHDIQPQNPHVEGKLSIEHKNQQREKSQEFLGYINYAKSFNNWNLNIGVKGTVYNLVGDATYFSLDPNFSVSKVMDDVTLRASYGWNHQYLSRIGFSNLGLPTEFWISSDKKRAPQSSRNIAVSLNIPLDNNNYNLVLEAYYKNLYNQLEYDGNILDFINSTYDLDDVILYGDGKNYGINLMLHKRTGRLKGWLSYAWGRALRKFEDEKLPSIYPASHERIHEFNSVLTYDFNERWNVGTTFVLASGTPFTAPKYFYLMNGQIVSEYGEHNANRLRPYSRLDFSVNYTFKKKNNSEQGINFSIYNSLFRKNDIFYRLKIHDDEFSYHSVRFILRALPSISYYYKF